MASGASEGRICLRISASGSARILLRLGESATGSVPPIGCTGRQHQQGARSNRPAYSSQGDAATPARVILFTGYMIDPLVPPLRAFPIPSGPKPERRSWTKCSKNSHARKVTWSRSQVQQMAVTSFFTMCAKNWVSSTGCCYRLPQTGSAMTQSRQQGDSGKISLIDY